MGSESSLKTWVSDKLMSLLGYSNSAVVQFVIGICKLPLSFMCLFDSFFFFFSMFSSL